jgi:hypothetical protein
MMIRVEMIFKTHGVRFRLPCVTQWTDASRWWASGLGIRFIAVTQRRIEALAETPAEMEAAAREAAAKTQGRTSAGI